MFGIKDIMTTDVAVVKKETPIDEAVRILVEKNITGLPVVNEDMTLAGIITERDVLRLLWACPQEPATVEKYMSKNVVSFDENDDLIAVCECFIKSRFRRVPIVSDGKLIGIISRRDIIRYILEPIG